MPFFKWIGITENEVDKGKFFARSYEHAEQKLEAKKIDILVLRPYKPLLQKKISLTEKAQFMRQLSELLFAGIHLFDALSIVRASIKNDFFLIHLDDCIQAVSHGVPFYQACSYYTSLFDPLIIALLTAGHETGNLAEATHKIAEYLEGYQGFRNRLRTALMMPCITGLFFIAITFFIFLVIVPRFETLLASVQAPLPLITRIILSISSWLRSVKGMFFILLFFIFLPFIFYILRKTPFRKRLDYLALRMPFIGKFIYYKAMGHYLMITGILVSQRIHLTHALQEAEKLLVNTALKNSFNKVMEGVKEGKAFSTLIENEPLLMHVQLILLIRIGETTGKLDRMLLQASLLFQKRIENILLRGTTFIQPLLLVVLGIFISVLIIAIYLPLLSLTAHINTF